MNNLSRQLESLFVDLESRLPTFDDVDNDALGNDGEDNELPALEAAYPVFYHNLNISDDIDLDSLELSPRIESPRKTEKLEKPRESHTQIVYELENSRNKVDACIGDDAPSTSETEQKDVTPVRTPRTPVLHDDLPSYSFGSNSALTRAQVESRDLVDKYFPPTGIQLSTAGLESDDLDRILECIDDDLEVGVPDCFQRAETMLVDPPHSKPLVQHENNAAVILEKLIVHAAKYDEGLKVKDFDLKNGSLKANKRHKHHKKEKRECWTGDDAAIVAETPGVSSQATSNETATCSRGVTASFPLGNEINGEKEPESEPQTVVLDLRLDEKSLEEKRRHIRRVQAILGISESSSSDDDDSNEE